MPADDLLRKGLASVPPAARGQDPSPARARIRETFREMEAARKRGLTWAQITALLEAEGTKAADGSPLTVNEVRALFHSEKQLRLSRQGRRKGPSKRGSLGPLVITSEPAAPPEPEAAQTAAPESPAPSPQAAEPTPAAEGQFATGDAALDRALNSVRKLTPLPPMGRMNTQGRRKAEPKQEKQDDGEDG